jgi:hypothetical protein
MGNTFKKNSDGTQVEQEKKGPTCGARESVIAWATMGTLRSSSWRWHKIHRAKYMKALILGLPLQAMR